jgi:hypothetical protein
VKIKAGRIIPALVTTTAVVAGLVAVQLVQLVAKVPVDKLKNSFVNLAVPFIAQAEPGPPPSRSLTATVCFTDDIELLHSLLRFYFFSSCLFVHLTLNFLFSHSVIILEFYVISDSSFFLCLDSSASSQHLGPMGHPRRTNHIEQTIRYSVGQIRHQV